MSEDLFIPLVMRWLHILSAIVATGGAIFSLLVLLPAAGKTLQPADREQLTEAVRTRWQRFIHAAILFFLISGFYNYLTITRHQHEDQPLYHALFGVKFLLAMAVFALALALTSSRPWSRRLRTQGRRWLAALVACAVAVVMISSVLRTLPKTVPATPTVALTSAEPSS